MSGKSNGIGLLCSINNSYLFRKDVKADSHRFYYEEYVIFKQASEETLLRAIAASASNGMRLLNCIPVPISVAGEDSKTI